MRRFRGNWRVMVFLFLCFLGARGWSQSSALDEGRGNYLTLKVAVMGPGDQLYFWWGHIALIIEDSVSGQSRFYDYGLFSFETDHFFTNFALGRLFYSCGVSGTDPNLNGYIRTNRDVKLYTLDLPAAEKEEIRRFVEWNVLPENRTYSYHHFRDNCSTRIRDILDRAVRGQFNAQFGTAPGRYTLREHVRRHTWFSPFFDWFLNFLMGQDIDTPITVWEECFLPQELGDRIMDFAYVDAEGTERKLVRSMEVLHVAQNRPAIEETPGFPWPWALIPGFLIAAAFILIALIRRRYASGGRILWGLGQSLLGLFFGLAGSLLFFMTFFTDHDYTYHNGNILFVHPLLLAAVPLGIRLALGKDPRRSLLAERRLNLLWTLVLAGGLVTLGMRFLPGFYQQNQITEALILPFALVLSYIPRWVGRLKP